jgi:hypothetical protein
MMVTLLLLMICVLPFAASHMRTPISARNRENELVKVPQGCCWVEGDCAAHSVDSNYYGPIPAALLLGTVSLVIWPPER